MSMRIGVWGSATGEVASPVGLNELRHTWLNLAWPSRPGLVGWLKQAAGGKGLVLSFLLKPLRLEQQTAPHRLWHSSFATLELRHIEVQPEIDGT